MASGFKQYDVEPPIYRNNLLTMLSHMNSIKYFLTLIKLTYITFPFYKEDNPNTARNSWNFYCAALCMPIMGFFWDAFSPFAYHYPALNDLQVVTGIVVRDERTKGGGHRVSETFKIKTADGQVLELTCTTLGNKCFDEPTWASYVNQPAKVWVYDDYAMQIEVAGQVAPWSGYENFKRVRTRNHFPFFFWISFPFMVWALRRSWRLYAHKAKALLAPSFI
jgi:hypothetical protein